MRYSWTAEQELLGNSVRRYLADHHSFVDRRRQAAAAAANESWQGLAELGLLGLPFAEAYGGTAGSDLDTVIVMEAFGRALVTEPYIPTVVLGGGLLRHAGSESQRAELIPAVIAGEHRLAFGFAEAASRFNLANVAATARPNGAGYVLNGKKIVVYGAPEAQTLFVTARTAGSTLDPEGISLFMVPSSTPGVSLRSYYTADSMSAADVTFVDVRLGPGNLVGPAGSALPIVERVLDEAVVAVCAEAVGAMEAVNESCLEHCKTRIAFGQTLSKFQVIQHRLVDMRLAYEQTAAIVLKAALALTAAPVKRGRAASACKVQVGQEAAFIGKNAVQLYGAIGITEELAVGHYFKRLTLIQTLFGSGDYHLRRYLRLTDAGPLRSAALGH